MRLIKNIILILSLFLYSTMQSQNITGTWTWKYQDKHQSEITLKEVSSSEFKGNYCSSFYNGSKIDCEEELPVNDYCIFLTKVAPNIFEGTFESAFSNTVGKMKIEYISVTDELKIYITEEPQGEFYLPTNAIFTKL